MRTANWLLLTAGLAVVLVCAAGSTTLATAAPAKAGPITREADNGKYKFSHVITIFPGLAHRRQSRFFALRLPLRGPKP